MSIDHGRSIDTIYPLSDNPTISEIDTYLTDIPITNRAYAENAEQCDALAKRYMRDGREMSAGKCRGEARIFREWIAQNNERAEQLKAIRLRLEVIHVRDGIVNNAFEMLNNQARHFPDHTETGIVFNMMVDIIAELSADIHAMGGE